MSLVRPSGGDRSPRAHTGRRRRRAAFRVEMLEGRTLMSGMALDTGLAPPAALFARLAAAGAAGTTSAAATPNSVFIVTTTVPTGVGGVTTVAVPILSPVAPTATQIVLAMSEAEMIGAFQSAAAGDGQATAIAEAATARALASVALPPVGQAQPIGFGQSFRPSGPDRPNRSDPAPLDDNPSPAPERPDQEPDAAPPLPGEEMPMPKAMPEGRAPGQVPAEEPAPPPAAAPDQPMPKTEPKAKAKAKAKGDEEGATPEMGFALALVASVTASVARARRAGRSDAGRRLDEPARRFSDDDHRERQQR